MIKGQAIKRIVESLQAEVYVEVGVALGGNFVQQPMPPLGLKIAVSPDVAQAKYVDTSDTRNCMLPLLSDDFFRLWQIPLRRMGVDVVFIDGNHTWQQSEKDVRNVLECLTDDGVIILHDSSPLTKLMAEPAQTHEHFKKAHPGESHCWCGDVWKAILCLRSLPEFEHVDLFNLDIVTGLTIVTRCKRVLPLYFDRKQFEKINYEDLDAN